MSSILLQVFLGSSLLYITKSYSSDMGTCKMVCEDPNGVSSWGVNSARSRPGKRGPSGLKGEKGVNGITGPKGDAADPCICPEHTHLQKQIDDLRNQLKRLDKIHRLMNEGQYELRVDMADFENNTAFAKYSHFYVGGPATFYALTASGYTGNAGNDMGLTNVSFSTKDQDHDTAPSHCAQRYKGSWWYTKCHSANPNGLYLGGVHESYAKGVVWRQFKGYHYSLKFLEMKMRKKNI